MGNETLRPLGFGPCFGHKLQTKKQMMYSPGGPYIVVAPVVTSWAVAGQQVVFLHMYLQTRVTLRAFPVATPRGRSVSFPIQGTMVTYVTWDVSLTVAFSSSAFFGLLFLIFLLTIVKSIQVTFIYIALLTIQIVSKQLHNIKIGQILS